MDHRILVPVITPFKEDETVDYAALKRLVRHLLDSGAEGIYAGGSSAECFLLSEEERQKTLEAVIEAAQGAFVVANIGSVGTRKAEMLAMHAAQAGADAISSVPPFYFRFSFKEIKNYYHDLSHKTKLPMMIYNIPATTGSDFTVAQLENLLFDECVQYIKFTDTDFFMLEQIKSHTGKFVYSGKDEDFLSGLAAGADGGIGSTFNIMLKKFIEVLNCWKESKTKQAQKVQHSINEVVRCVCECGLIESIKYVLGLQGIDCGHARRPFKQVGEAEQQKLKSVLFREGVL